MLQGSEEDLFTTTRSFCFHRNDSRHSICHTVYLTSQPKAEDSMVINWNVVPAEIGSLIDNHRKGHCSYNSRRKIIMLKWIVFSQLSLCLEAHTVKHNRKQIRFCRIFSWLGLTERQKEKKSCFDQNSSGWKKLCSALDPNPKMQKFCNTLDWLGRTNREMNENSPFFFTSIQAGEQKVLKMLIHKAVHLTCASFALIKRHELVKLPSTWEEKLLSFFFF